MAKKKRRTRRRSSFSVLNALEAYVYATILTEGVAGTSPIGLITGATDIGSTVLKTSTGLGSEMSMSTVVTGADAISLGDIATEPALAFSSNQQNCNQVFEEVVIRWLNSVIMLKATVKFLQVDHVGMDPNWREIVEDMTPEQVNDWLETQNLVLGGIGAIIGLILGGPVGAGIGGVVGGGVANSIPALCAFGRGAEYPCENSTQGGEARIRSGAG